MRISDDQEQLSQDYYDDERMRTKAKSSKATYSRLYSGEKELAGFRKGAAGINP